MFTIDVLVMNSRVATNYYAGPYFQVGVFHRIEKRRKLGISYVMNILFSRFYQHKGNSLLIKIIPTEIRGIVKPGILKRLVKH